VVAGGPDCRSTASHPFFKSQRQKLLGIGRVRNGGERQQECPFEAWLVSRWPTAEFDSGGGNEFSQRQSLTAMDFDIGVDGGTGICMGPKKDKLAA
jgi:hypothetical protein